MEISTRINLKGKGYSRNQMDTPTLVNGMTTSPMEKENKYSKMEMSTRGLMLVGKNRAYLANINGIIQNNMTNTLEDTRMTISQGRENLRRKTARLLRESSMTMMSRRHL